MNIQIYGFFFSQFFFFAFASLSSCSSHSIYLESLKFIKIPFSFVQSRTHLFWVCLAIESLTKFERDKQNNNALDTEINDVVYLFYTFYCVSRVLAPNK